MSRFLNFIKLPGLALIPLIFLGFYASGQTITKNIPSPVSGTVCPNISTSYSVSIPGNFGTCKIKWTVTNGTINGLDNQQNVLVTWNDSPGVTATITVTFSGCASGNPNEGVTRSKNELILSIKDQEWGPYGNSVNLDYCIKAQVNLSVSRMFVQGTGGVAQPTLTEVIYGWTIPAGWQIAGTTKTGFQKTTVHFISIEPIKCSIPGSVKVQGFINDASLCGSAGPSKIATISLNGSNPVATVSPQAGYSGASLCNTNPVTFYATTNGVFNCISSYSWSYSTSWTKLSQTGNSITLRPSGSPSDASAISATINFSCGSSITNTYTPTYPPNILTGPDILCATGLYSVTNSSGVPITWSSSNSSIATINALGEAERVGSAAGAVTITARACGGATTLTKNVKVGNYPPTGTSSVNSNCSGNSFNVLNTSLSAACTANTNIYFTYRITDPNYSNFVFTPVSVPSGATWSFSGGNLYMTVTTPPSFGSRSATIALSATGPCGPYNLSFTSTAVNYYSSFFSISPNPSKENVTISMDTEDLLNDNSQNLIYAIKITDLFGTSGKSFEYKTGVNSINIPLQDFNPGLHILSVFDGKIWSSKQLIIQK